MAAGLRSLLRPWAGGVSAPAATRGLRSQLRPWMGGVCAPLSEVTAPGLRSMHRRWMGGICAPGATEPPLAPPGFLHRMRMPSRRAPEDDDELLLALCGALCAAAGVLER